jgi:hypothetical protein
MELVSALFPGAVTEGSVARDRRRVNLGSGQGGYNEDHEFYGYRMPI